VGYSPRAPKGAAGVMSALEQRSMFTMWAALPTALILSADVRAGAPSGGVDAEALATLTNAEVRAVNQDALAAPMRCVANSSDGGALQVWRKPLAAAGAAAVVLFHRGADTSGPLPQPPAVRAVSASWAGAALMTDQRLRSPSHQTLLLRLQGDAWANDLGHYMRDPVTLQLVPTGSTKALLQSIIAPQALQDALDGRYEYVRRLNDTDLELQTRPATAAECFFPVFSCLSCSSSSSVWFTTSEGFGLGSESARFPWGHR
jgi:hypothetical protein